MNEEGVAMRVGQKELYEKKDGQVVKTVIGARERIVAVLVGVNDDRDQTTEI